MWNRFFHRPPKHDECPYCKLQWNEDEEFKIVDGKCIFKEHRDLYRWEKVEAYKMLKRNGFNIKLSYTDNGHFVVYLRYNDG